MAGAPEVSRPSDRGQRAVQLGFGTAGGTAAADAPAREGAAAEPQLASLMREYARMRQELEQSQHVKSDFLATMSHELRTPLNIIMGYVDLVLDGEFGALNAQQSTVLGLVAKSAVALLELINATLNLSRLERGEASLDIRPVALADLLADALAQAREAHDTGGVELVLRVPADLGSIHTDAAKLMMIVRSVISNALKFTLKGTVTLTAGVAAGGATIVVADTGIGIAPEVVPIIFESFRQGDSAMTRRFGGVGLGLYIARRLLDLLGGTIAMETHVGRGSTFTIWVPDRSPLPAGAPTPDG